MRMLKHTPERPSTRKYKPADIQKKLLESGVKIELNDAVKILDFMYKMAKLVINQEFKK